MWPAEVFAEHAADTHCERLRGNARHVALDNLDGLLWAACLATPRMRRHTHQSPLRHHRHPLCPRVNFILQLAEFFFCCDYYSTFFSVFRKSIYNLVGSPLANKAQYSSLEKMIRVYVGVTNRSKDINKASTYRVAKIITVNAELPSISINFCASNRFSFSLMKSILILTRRRSRTIWRSCSSKRTCPCRTVWASFVSIRIRRRAWARTCTPWAGGSPRRTSSRPRTRSTRSRYRCRRRARVASPIFRPYSFAPAIQPKAKIHAM